MAKDMQTLLNHVERMMGAGSGLGEMQFRLGMSRANVQKLVQQVKMRRGEITLVIPLETLRTAYLEASETIEELAAECGCSTIQLRRYLQANGVFRDRGHLARNVRPVWNKGLTKDDDERLADLSAARTGEQNPMAGQPAWNRGLTAKDNEIVAEMAAKRRGRRFSEEHRENLAESKRGKFGASANRWKGGHVNGGYAIVGDDSGRRFVHRQIAEALLRRRLSSDEHVHHRDLNRVNNAPENLIVLRAGDHSALHVAMRRDPALDQSSWLQARGAWFVELDTLVEKEAA